MLSKKLFSCTIFLLILFLYNNSLAQQIPDSSRSKMQDSTSKKNILALDTSVKKHSPRIATFRSAVLPGWGQAYNKKYWKIPIIYGALGVTTGVFIYNLKTYKRLKTAIILRSDSDPLNDTLVYKDFIHLSTESIRSYRNSFRQSVDYAVLFFIAFWALNVVDATVDAHLKSFDVSDNISLRIKPGYDPNIKTGNLSLVFSFKDNRSKVLSSQR